MNDKGYQKKQLWWQHQAYRLFPAGVGLGLLFGGCAPVGPDYQPVEPAAPAAWHAQLSDGLSAESGDPRILSHWWRVLGDDQLDNLIIRAIGNNLDLKEAAARILEARALRGINRAELFPTLDGSASTTTAYSSENRGGNGGGEVDLYAVGFDAGWELDIFGGVRRANEAAQADLEAARENLHDTLVSLLGEVALNYLEVRTFQARLVAISANIAAQEETHLLNRSRYEAGLIGELAVRQSLYTLERTRTQIPGLQSGLSAAQNRLAVLLGLRPGALDQELAEAKPIPVTPPTVAVGVPAETLRRRPDIRRAERNLAAQTARIGAATADLYPKFRLAGSIGLESLSSSTVLDWASRTWALGPSVSWSLFDGCAIRQNIEVQTTRQEQALIQYEAAVLAAQEEVENVLVAYVKEQQRREALQRAVTAATEAFGLAEDQYQAGLVDFTNVIDVQRELQSLQDELAQSEGAVTSNLIRLYKALGGGWDAMATNQ